MVNANPTRRRARIALVQFDPQLGRVDDNIAEVTRLTEGLKPGSVDLLCFPEMAFTGYSFPDLETITPFLELPAQGPTYRFCSALAQKLKCYIAVGYPEKIIIPPSADSQSIEEHLPNGISHLAANSALVISPEGEIITKYRKTNLFEYDVPWAQPGHGYAIVDLPLPLGKIALGICMDMNPITSKVITNNDEVPYELADFAMENDAHILLLLSNWLDPGEAGEDDEYCMRTINYWANRVWPMFRDEQGVATSDDAEAEDGNEDDGEANEDDEGDEKLVVICNRTGVEKGTTFVGSSLIFSTSKSRRKIDVVGVMKRKETRLRIWEC